VYLGVAAPASSVLLGIPSGVEGVRATLKIMRALVRKHRATLPIREFAMRLTQSLPQKDWAGQVRKLHEFVRDGVRYVKDVNGVETVQTPDYTLRMRAGDCDDKATLLAALLESIGHPSQFLAVGPVPGRFSHVLVETRIGARWVPLETTAPVSAGWAPRAPSKMRLKI